MTTRELARFYNEVGEKYCEEKFVYATPWGVARRSFVLRLLGKFSQPGVFLDIGCGGGVFLKEFHRFGAKTILGLDISLPSLLRAKKSLPNSNFICGDAEKMPFKDNSADTVLCSETIEHLENPVAVISEIARVMKQGAIAIITCPNYKGLRPHRENIGILRDFGVSGESYIHSAYTPQEIADMSGKYGLKTIEYGTFEKELRIWGRLFDELFRIVYRIMKKMNLHPKFFILSYKIHGIIGTIFLLLMTLTGIRYIWRALFKRGPRTFVILKK